jgi:hypothetical protein
VENHLLKYTGNRDDRRKWRKDLKVAFDVDMTLIDHEDRPLYNNINILRFFIHIGYDVIVWSGGGSDGEGSYAGMHCRKLGIHDLVRIIPKGSEEVDIAFDDEQVQLGKVNVVV